MSAYEVALPEYLRRDLAYQDVENIPIAGLGLTPKMTIPGAFWCDPLAIHVTLVTDATVANRTVSLRFNDGIVAAVADVAAPVAQTASQVGIYTWLKGVGSSSGPSSFYFTMPLPAIYVPSGWNVIIRCEGIQPGDAFSQATMVCNKIPTGPPDDSAYPGRGNLRLLPTPFV